MMKNLFIAACLVLSGVFAHAELIARARTMAGGSINLTDEVGQCEKDFRTVVLVAPTGEYMLGCWQMLSQETIIVVYSDKTSRIYETSAFRSRPQPTQSNQPASKTGKDV